MYRYVCIFIHIYGVSTQTGPSALPLILFRTVPGKSNNKNDLLAGKCKLGTQVLWEINTSYKQMGTHIFFPADYLQPMVWSFMPDTVSSKSVCI